MSFEMSENSRTIKVYNLRGDTKEFIGAGQAYIPPNTGLPANCTIDEPPEIPSGSVAVYDSGIAAWSLEDDHRGETVYDTNTGQEILIMNIGILPANTTATAPTGSFQKWNGEEWVTDIDAEKTARLAEATSKRDILLAAAAIAIAPLQYAVDLDEATEDEIALLKKWKQYVVALNRLDLSTAPDIIWPEVPTVTV